MTSTGEGILFHEDEHYDFTYIYGVYPFQIRFNDNPSPSERSERMETIKKLYPDCTVQTAGEYADEGTGGAGGYLNDINEVSGGQLQRACICRSMINSPKMIFADEPTGALNRQSSDEVMEELRRINDEGTTIMLVTHDAKVAAKCSRVMFIVDGNIKGEYHLGKYEMPSDLRDRERSLNNWLLEQGW